MSLWCVGWAHRLTRVEAGASGADDITHADPMFLPPKSATKTIKGRYYTDILLYPGTKRLPRGS